jgi:hypothetical protein
VSSPTGYVNSVEVPNILEQLPIICLVFVAVGTVAGDELPNIKNLHLL